MIMHRGVRRESKMIDQVREVSLRLSQATSPIRGPAVFRHAAVGVLKVYYCTTQPRALKELQKDSTILIR
jgi:hypothetical protein